MGSRSGFGERYQKQVGLWYSHNALSFDLCVREDYNPSCINLGRSATSSITLVACKGLRTGFYNSIMVSCIIGKAVERMNGSDMNTEKKKLLLVEDDTAIAMGLEYSLQQENYEVTTCGSAASAMARISSEKYDIALLDVSLPDGNGFDICKKLKIQGDTPVIFLTARDDEGSVVLGLDIGADDYITKPFRIRELQSRIRSVLRRSVKATGGDVMLQYGNVTVNVSKGKVKKNGSDVFLTALEYRLFLTLINNEGRIVTRNQLLESIWDVSGDFVNDNTLTVYIKRLREKIEDDPQNPAIIKTIRGLGYQLS